MLTSATKEYSRSCSSRWDSIERSRERSSRAELTNENSPRSVRASRASSRRDDARHRIGGIARNDTVTRDTGLGTGDERTADCPECARRIGPRGMQIGEGLRTEIALPGPVDEPQLEAPRARDDDASRCSARDAVQVVDDLERVE